MLSKKLKAVNQSGQLQEMQILVKWWVMLQIWL